VFAPADLVHADTEDAVEAGGVQVCGDDPPAGSAHGTPRHAAQPCDRGLVHLGRQPCQQVVEVAGQLGAGTGEGDALDDDTVVRAPQAPQRRSDLDPPPAHVEMAPRRCDRTGVITPPGLVAAVAAHEAATSQRNGHENDRGAEGDAGDVDAIEAHETLECCGDAHGLMAFLSSRFQHLELWPRSVRVTRTPRTGAQPTPPTSTPTPPPTCMSGEPYFRIRMPDFAL